MASHAVADRTNQLQNDARDDDDGDQPRKDFRTATVFHGFEV
jgi:hypothetical protein